MPVPTHGGHIVTTMKRRGYQMSLQQRGVWYPAVAAFGFDFRLIATIGKTIFIPVVITTLGWDTDTTFFSLPVNC